MRKKIICLVLALILMLLSGCSNIPMPGATMKPPSVPKEKRGEGPDYKKMASKYIPEGAKLEDVNNTSVYLVDVDGDLKPEYLVTYRLDESRVGALLLKKSGSGYNTVWTDVGKGYGFDTVKVADVTGDGLADILIGWTIGSSAGNALDVFSWRGGALQNIYRTSYHKIDVEDMDGYYGKDNVAEIAFWTKDTGEAYDVKVMRWNERDKDFESAPDVYQVYYPEVVKYYEDKVKTMSNSRYYWYYLGIAQYRAGQYEDALDSVDSGIKLSGGYLGDAEFSLLRADILKDTYKLGKAYNIYDGLLHSGKPEDAHTIAMAYFGKGEVFRIRGDYDMAEECYKKAQKKSMEVEFRRAINRLPVYKAVDIVENHVKNLKSGNFNGEKFVDWAKENGIILSCKDLKTNINGINRIVFVDYYSEGLMKAHEIFWWDRGTLKKQLIFSNEFSMESIFTSAVTGCRAAQGGDGLPEIGIIADTAYLGNKEPRPYYTLLKLEDDRWKTLWSPPMYKWRNNNGTLRFNGPGLDSLNLWGDSGRVSDNKNNIFDERNGGPRRHFVDKWQRTEDSYKLTEYETDPSAYNTLVEFVFNISQGDDDVAKKQVSDPALIKKAKICKLIQPKLNERWKLKLNGKDAERNGPLTIMDGPAKGVTFTFGQRGQDLLITDIIKRDI